MGVVVWRAAVLGFLLLAGCAQPPAGPEYLRDTVFETIPERSVIYVVRTPFDSRESSGLILDEKVQFATLAGTFYRWEVAPGTHRVAGFASASEWSCSRPRRAGFIFSSTPCGVIRATGCSSPACGRSIRSEAARSWRNRNRAGKAPQGNCSPRLASSAISCWNSGGP